MLSNKKYVHVLRCRRESDTYSKSRDNNLPNYEIDGGCLYCVSLEERWRYWLHSHGGLIAKAL